MLLSGFLPEPATLPRALNDWTPRAALVLPMTPVRPQGSGREDGREEAPRVPALHWALLSTTTCDPRVTPRPSPHSAGSRAAFPQAPPSSRHPQWPVNGFLFATKLQASRQYGTGTKTELWTNGTR